MSLFPIIMPVAANVASVTKTDNATYITGGTTHTYSSKSFGAADTSRHIVVAFGSGNGGNGNRTITSITIGGVAATVLITRADASGVSNNVLCGIAIAAVPSGTTGDVVIVFSGTVEVSGIGVFSVLNSAASASATAFADVTGTPTLDLTITCPAGGVIIAMAYSSGGFGNPWTWVNLTEQYDTVVRTSSRHSGTSDAFATLQTNLAVTATPAGSAQNNVAVAVALATV